MNKLIELEQIVRKEIDRCEAFRPYQNQNVDQRMYYMGRIDAMNIVMDFISKQEFSEPTPNKQDEANAPRTPFPMVA